MWITAKKVLSRRSEMTIFSTLPPSCSSTERRRSWVIGRGGSTPSMRSAMALASKTPIQMGRKSWLPTSRRITIGTFDEGSSINPLISTWSSSFGLLIPLFWAPERGEVKVKRGSGGDRDRGFQAPAQQAVWKGGLHPHLGRAAQGDRLRAGLEVD